MMSMYGKLFESYDPGYYVRYGLYKCKLCPFRETMVSLNPDLDFLVHWKEKHPLELICVQSTLV